MTEQEAVEIITNTVQKENMTVEQDRALAIVQKAAEKQKPKKPITFDYGNGTINYGCPKCRRKFISKIDGEWCAGTFQKFCENCGQAIDWSEEE